MKYQWLATAAFGLEGVVRKELNDLGLSARAENGAVRFEGTAQDAFRAALWLRCADRVQLLVAEGPVKTFEDLFRLVRGCPWQKFLPRNAAFPVSGKCVRSQLMSVSDCQAITKKALAEELMAYYHMPWCEENGAQYPVQVAIHSDHARVTLDACGDALNRRGYRTWNGEAPLRETLAAAIILLSPWKKGQPLHDPCCGTGTLLIEAAMIAANRAPGLYRSFLMEKWGMLSAHDAEMIRNQAKAAMVLPDIPPISGTDIDEAAVELANRHIQQARLQDYIHVSVCDLKELNLETKDIMFVANPPYGERLSDKKSCEKLYHSMREMKDRHEGSRLCVLTGHPGFERAFGQRASKKRRLYNGRLECEYLIY